MSIKPIGVSEMVENTMKLANAYCIQRKKEHIVLTQTLGAGISERINGDQIRVQQGMSVPRCSGMCCQRKLSLNSLS